MKGEETEDPKVVSDDTRERLDELGEDLDKLEEEALPKPAQPADVGGAVGT